MKNKDFMVMDIFSQYILVSEEDGYIEMMDIDRSKEASKEEAQIGRVIDTGKTTENLFNSITENLDSVLNVIFDFLNEEEVEEFKKFGKLLKLARGTYIYDKCVSDDVIGEFAVYDTDTEEVLRDEEYNFIHHTYAEVGETVNNFHFVDMTNNSYKILEMLLDQCETIHNISEVLLLKNENYMNEIESSVEKLLDLYNSHKTSIYWGK